MKNKFKISLLIACLFMAQNIAFCDDVEQKDLDKSKEIFKKEKKVKKIEKIS